MPTSTTEPYKNLSKKIECSKGAEFAKRIKSFRTLHYIYEKNYSELMGCLAKVEAIGLHLTAVDKPGEDSNIRRTYNEVTRQIFNFLSSSKSRIDYTRRFVDENYRDTTFSVAFKEHIAEFYGQSELLKFVNDLRNYIIHEGIPHIGIRVNWSKSEAYIYLEKSKIIDSSFWTAPSKRFLEKCDDRILLFPLFIEYGNRVSAQVDWILDELYKHHSLDISEYNEMLSELDNLRK